MRPTLYVQSDGSTDLLARRNRTGKLQTLVTDRIEKELMTTGQYENIRAYSRPGESMVTIYR